MPIEHRMTHILLVEDDSLDVMNVKRAFAKANVSNPLHVAENGEVALRMLRDGGVPAGRRLVLLDLNMPRMNGIEFLKALRADPDLQSIPVVVLTTSAEDRDRIEAFRLNVAGYLLKPVTFGEFATLMAALNHYWTLSELP